MSMEGVLVSGAETALDVDVDLLTRAAIFGTLVCFGVEDVGGVCEWSVEAGRKSVRCRQRAGDGVEMSWWCGDVYKEAWGLGQAQHWKSDVQTRQAGWN